MSESSPPPSCSHCGSTLPEGVPESQCPRCLMAQIIEPTQAGSVADSLPSLSPEELAPHFPQLEILECLGRGGMGVVYKARQKSLNRIVALKLLAPERADDAKFAARFEKEAHALAALNHPHIVTIHDFGQAGGFFFLLMEFVDGVNLRQAMSAGRFTPPQALAIVPPICEALQYAHEHGIVHRDIKPENLLMDKEGRVKIADFGIAKMIGTENVDGGEALSQPFGTPTYAAPEQQSDPAHVDHRADIYSLGVVLYELLTGELPKSNLEAPSRRVEIDVRLDEIVLRALETRPELRFATAAEFRTRLADVVTSTSQRESTSLKTSSSYVSTPAHLNSLYGRFFYIYTGKGQLVLDGRQLAFSRDNEAPILIPLSAIRDLSIGQYPATAKPIAMNFISVTFDDGGTQRQLLFTPNEGALSPTWDTNRVVADWFKAIQDATRHATGSVPATTPADRLGVPHGWAMQFLPPLAVLAGFGLLLTTLLSRHLDHEPKFLLMMIGLLLMIGGPIFIGMFSRSRPGAETLPPPRRYGMGCLILSIMAVAGAVAMIAGWSYLHFSQMDSQAGVVERVTAELVSVEGRIVTAELGIYVKGGPVEVRAELNGEPTPDTHAGVLVDSDRNTGIRTLVLPGDPIGNHPWRIFQPGMHLWRLRYLLPTPELAKRAAEDLRPMGRLPAVAGRSYAGTVFQLGNPQSPDYHAVLHVSKVITAADPRWVSVEGQRTWNENTTRVTWTVRTSSSGAIHLLHGEGQRNTSLQRNATTKFHEAVIVVEITKIGSDRVKVATTFGAGTVGGEFGGDYLKVRDELLNTALNTAKSETGTRVELCRLDGKPLVVQVPVLINSPHRQDDHAEAATTTSYQEFPAKVVTVHQSWAHLFLPFIVGAVFLIGAAFVIRSLIKQGRSGCVVVAVIALAIALFLAAVSLVWYLSLARQVESQAVEVIDQVHEVAKASSTPMPSSESSVPMAIDFQVTKVESPAGSRDIRIFFERDANYGLGIEVWQDVIRPADVAGPSAKNPFWLRKQWIGLNDGRSLTWTLPDDFTPEEVNAAARQLEQELMSKGRIQLPDGAVPELGKVKHRDGWTYIMALRILREPGAPRPPAPKGALFSVEREIQVPGGACMRLQLLKSLKDGTTNVFDKPLVFKMANTTIFMLRWHAYAPALPNAGPTYVVDLVDPRSGAIFHRFEDGFSPGVVLSSPDFRPLPEANKSIVIARLGHTTIPRLLLANQPTAPGSAVTAWWDVYAEISVISPGGENVPQFQLPDQ